MPVEFIDEENARSEPFGRSFAGNPVSSMAALLIKIGVVRTEDQAKAVLIGTAIAAFIAAVSIFVLDIKNSASPSGPLTPTQIQEMQQIPPPAHKIG